MGVLKKLIEKSSFTTSKKRMLLQLSKNQVNMLTASFVADAVNYQKPELLGAEVLYIVDSANQMVSKGFTFDATKGVVAFAFKANTTYHIHYKA